MSWAQKQLSLHDFKTKIRIKTNLVLNPYCETKKKTKKTKQKHDTCKTRIQQDFLPRKVQK